MDGAHAPRPGERRPVVARGHRLAAADHAPGTHSSRHADMAAFDPASARDPKQRDYRQRTTTWGRPAPGRSTCKEAVQGWESEAAQSLKCHAPTQGPGRLSGNLNQGVLSSHEKSDRQDPPLAAPRQEAEDVADAMRSGTVRTNASSSRTFPVPRPSSRETVSSLRGQPATDGLRGLRRAGPPGERATRKGPGKPGPFRRYCGAVGLRGDQDAVAVNDDLGRS